MTEEKEVGIKPEKIGEGGKGARRAGSRWQVFLRRIPPTFLDLLEVRIPQLWFQPPEGVSLPELRRRDLARLSHFFGIRKSFSL